MESNEYTLSTMQSKLISPNTRAGWMGWWPGWRSVMDPENGRIRHFLAEQIAKIDDGARVLDASAGTRPFASMFGRQHYQSCDVPGGFYKGKHDFECYLEAIPKPDASYDAIVLTQVLEHVPNPEKVLKELARVMRPGGKLLLSVPLNGPLHGEPWHFFHFTHFGLAQLAINTGWRVASCEKIGGAFWLIGKRLGYLPDNLMKSIDPFRANKRNRSVVLCAILSTMFLPLWLVCILICRYLIRPLSYWLDRLDLDKTFTSGYTAVFEKMPNG